MRKNIIKRIKRKIRNFAIWLEHETSDFIIPKEIYDELSNKDIDKNVRADKAIEFCKINRPKHSGTWAESDFTRLETLANRIKAIGK